MKSFRQLNVLGSFLTAKSSSARKWLALLLALVVFNPAIAQITDPKVRICDCDSDSEFAWHAENLAMTESPFLFEGTQDVYVVNPATQDVRSFVVRREMTGSTVGIGGEFWTTEVNPGGGDPIIIDGLYSLIQAVRDFDAAIQGTVRLSDPHPPEIEAPPSIGSAADLLGPADSSAGFNRNALNNWMTSLMSREFNRAVEAAETGNFGDSFLEVFSSAVQAMLDFVGPNATVWVEFEDGTRVRVEQQSTNTSVDPNTGGIDGMEFNYEVDPSTAQGAGLNAFPISPGQFGGFGYSGGAVGGLGRLALRLGITLEFGGGEGGGGGDTCTGSLQCSVDGAHISCTTSLSQEEIANC